MKNQQYILSLLLGILSSMVLFLHASSKPVNYSQNKTLPYSIPPGNAVANSITNITICNNQLPYVWNSITCLTAGTYSATLTGSNGLDSIATLNLTVINISTSITNAIVCDNELPYQWNGNNYSSSGTYSVTLTSSSGCDSVPILSLTVNSAVTSTTGITVCSNQLPFTWNGNNYPAAGSYTVTLTSSAGCDSIATLNLTVKAVSSSNTVRTVCSNQLPFIWNGNSYPSAGTYSITLINSNGCDSVATLQLSTLPVVTSSTNVSVCSNQLPYSWNSNNYAGAGNYSVTLTGASGCDSVATLRLTVLPVKISTTSLTICTGQLPYNWNGNNYAAAGTYLVTLTGSNGCDSVATLQLTAVSFLTSITDETICNSELPYTWNGNIYVAAGIYTTSFLTTAGCDSIATLDLAVLTPQIATDSVSVCNEALPYNWYGQVFSAGGTYPMIPPVVIDACHSIDTLVLTVQLILPSTSVVTVCNNQLPYSWNGNNYSTTGIYGITLTSSSGCDSLTNLNLTVIPIATSTTAVSICSNQLPYNWNGNNFNASGNYPVPLLAANGCDSVATLALTVNPVTTSSTNLTVCSTQLPYNWNGNDYSTNGTYIVTLTNTAGCDSIATLYFVVQAFLTSTTNISVCSNQLPYSWNGNSYPSAGSFSINLTSSGGCDSVATLNLVVNDVITSTTNVQTCTNLLPYNWNGINYVAGGTYNVTLVTTGGCDSVATLNLVVNDPVTSTTINTICNNQLPYSWNGNSYPVAGVYPVTLTSSSGCDSIATLNLIVTDILTSTTNVTLCSAQLPYQWNGNSYPNGGTYSVTLTTPAGCDSVPILSLTVGPYVTSTTAVTICSNELPYSWSGNSYPAAGSYDVLITGLSICDSLATLNLSVLPPLTSITTITICEDQLPYSWNGNSYPAAGNYNVTLPGSAGCDSVASLILNTNPAVTSSTTIAICDNQLPYTWNGNTYPAGGTFVINLTSSTGCDSVATLILVANSTVTSSTNISICNNQLPYSWNGNSYPSAGNYTVTLTSVSGCDSLATLHLLANPTVSSTTDTSICDTQLPFIWNGNNYPAAGSYSITLLSSSGCDSIATLQLYTNPVVSSTTLAATCNNQLPYNWNGQNYSTAGLHTVTLVSAAGCDSVATIDLTIHPVVNTNFIASTCANQLPYLWNGQSYTATGNYPLIFTSAAGCDSVVTLQLTVFPVSTSTSNAATCSGQLPYTWNGQNFTTAGLHTVTLTSQAGCDSIATLNLTIDPTPAAPSVLSPLVYCQFETTAPLSASATTTNGYLLWYTAASGGTGSATIPVPSSASAGITNYYVSQVDGPCEGPRALITVTVNSKPFLGPDKPLQICFGQSANIGILYDTTGLTANWTNGQQVLTDASAITLEGTYQLIVENNVGCSDSASVTLGIQPPVVANAGNDDDAEYNFPYQLSGSGGGQYQWSPTGDLNNPFIANPEATLTHDETFVLMVIDEIGCFDLDTVHLRVLNGPTFYVPSAFTPNGDGLNDIFQPIPIGIASLEFFRVFNRFGELVYETSVIGKGWDGTYKGKKQPLGNYVWSLKGTDRTGKLKIMKGNVVMIR